MLKQGLILGFFFICLQSFGQGFYTEAYSGWAFPFNQSRFSYHYDHQLVYSSTGPAVDKYNYRVVKGSLGKGLNYGVVFGYSFRSNLGVELDFSYQKSSEITATYTDQHSNSFPGYSYSSFEEATMSWFSQMTRINPNFTVSTGWEKTKFHFKAGPVFSFGSFTHSIEDSGYEQYDDGFTTGSQSFSYEATEVYQGGFGLGINTSVGFEYKFNQNFSLMMTCRSINMNYAPKKSKLTEYKVDGVDRLNEMSTSLIETEYLDEYEEDYTQGPPSKDEPSKNLKQWYPFSSIGAQLSVRFNFGAKKTGDPKAGIK